MVMLRSVRGMNDLFEIDLLLIRKLEKEIVNIFSLYGFNEIRTPILEELSLFKRGVGENSDIVEKEMFIVKDNEHEYCLRPENTASVVRALLQKGGIDEQFSEKVFYLGPMFRKERPQKGRLRQFHQYGIESFGCKNPLAEVEVISMMDTLLKKLAVNNIELHINSLGEALEKQNYQKVLYDFLLNFTDNMCEDCQRRIHKNTLRILDCKKESCQKIAKSAPSSLMSLTDESKKHFDEVLNYLSKENISFVLQPNLVRGLDYYTKTVFEWVATDNLGAQNALAAGGRYDGLFSNLGSKIDVPAVGLAGGMERLVLLTQENIITNDNQFDLALIYADDDAKAILPSLAFALRKSGVKADFSLEEKSLKAQMRRADKLNASFVIVIGKNELDNQKVIAKSFKDNQKIELPLSYEHIAGIIINKK